MRPGAALAAAAWLGGLLAGLGLAPLALAQVPGPAARFIILNADGTQAGALEIDASADGEQTARYRYKYNGRGLLDRHRNSPRRRSDPKVDGLLGLALGCLGLKRSLDCAWSRFWLCRHLRLSSPSFQTQRQQGTTPPLHRISNVIVCPRDVGSSLTLSKGSLDRSVG